jgi:hypothetical protein
MSPAKGIEMEQKVVDEVSAEELMKHTAFISEEDRLSGSEGEARAVEYFGEVMTNLGFEVNLKQVENFLSLPLNASATVISPESKDLPCITQSFSASTPPEGIEAELIYVPQGSDPEVKDKIVMREGLAAPAPTWDTEHKGAAGQIWINSGDLPRNMCVATIWGHPTPETAHRIPKTPTISLARAHGEYLKKLCAAGPVKICLKTEVWTGFKQLPLAVAEVKGSLEPDIYVLFNGHVDSWHKGASDNGTANACILETARMIAKYRGQLRRGVRFAWWSGHSHGRYCGSNWYADHNWEDLHRHAIVHLNVDSLGCQGATEYPDVECSAECYQLGKDVIEKYTGQSPHYQRIGHSGDNSFWGIGLPTLYQLLSRQPKEAGSSDSLIPGLAWFWHTEADTIDKIDPEILLKDTRVYMAALWRLCTAPVLPFNFETTAEEIISLLKGLQDKAGQAFDLGPALEKAEVLKQKAMALSSASQRITKLVLEQEPDAAADQLNSAAAGLNACLMKLSRILVPASYSAVDRFESDLAVPIPPFPRLQPVAELASMDDHSNAFKFLERKMVRERNRVCHALIEAAELIEQTLNGLNA